MKKALAALAVIAAFIIAVPAQAQIKFGVKAGLNMTKFSLNAGKENLKSDNTSGFFAGVQAETTIPLVGIGAEVGLMYDHRKLELGDGNKNLDYIAVPVNLKYTYGFSSLASVYVATGPQFSWNVGGKQLFKNTYSLKSSEFSWNIGAGATVVSHLRVGYNYNIGIGETAELSLLDTGGKLFKGKLKNNSHQISVAYIF